MRQTSNNITWHQLGTYYAYTRSIKILRERRELLRKRLQAFQPPKKGKLRQVTAPAMSDVTLWCLIEGDSAPFTVTAVTAPLDIDIDDLKNLVHEKGALRRSRPLEGASWSPASTAWLTYLTGRHLCRFVSFYTMPPLKLFTIARLFTRRYSTASPAPRHLLTRRPHLVRIHHLGSECRFP